MRGDDTFAKVLSQRREQRGLRGSILLFAILAFLILAGFWAAYTEIDDVTRTDGRVVPSGNLQTIQAPEGGSIERVFVREGDVVDAGAILMEMDRTQFAGQLDQERQQALALGARLARLRSEVEGGELVFSEEVRVSAPDLLASERDLYEARRSELAAEIAVLEVQRVQQREALSEAHKLMSSAQRTRALVDDQIAIIEPLVERGLEPQTSLLQLQIQISELEGSLAQAGSRLAQETARLAEIEQRIASIELRFRSEALEELNWTMGELAGLRPALPVLERRLDETEIRSPLAGVVNQVFVSSHGGIVATGAELLEIVPIDDNLLVEAYVRPADIAFLHVGQRVNVKITAYDFARYGSLTGEIRLISAGPSRHPEREENVFIVEVETSGQLSDVVGQPLAIVPGMIAEVEFVSDRKSVLDYILKPVVRVKDRAFRD